MSAFVRVARPTFEYLRFASSESGKDRDLNTAPLVINEFGTVSEARGLGRRLRSAKKLPKYGSAESSVGVVVKRAKVFQRCSVA